MYLFLNNQCVLDSPTSNTNDIGNEFSSEAAERQDAFDVGY